MRFIGSPIISYISKGHRIPLQDILIDCCLFTRMKVNLPHYISLQLQPPIHTEPYPFSNNKPPPPPLSDVLPTLGWGPRPPNTNTTTSATIGNPATTPNGATNKPVRSFTIPNGNGPITDPNTVMPLATDCTVPRCLRP